MSPQMKNARQALKNKDFFTAVELYEEHLSIYPDDNKALMEYGISNFLAGNEEKFMEIHCKLENKIEKNNIKPENQALWNTCKSFMNSIIKGAAIAGIASLPLISACNKEKVETKAPANSKNTKAETMKAVSVPTDATKVKTNKQEIKKETEKQQKADKTVKTENKIPVKQVMGSKGANVTAKQTVPAEKNKPEPQSNKTTKTDKTTKPTNTKPNTFKPKTKYRIVRHKYGIRPRPSYNPSTVMRPALRYGLRRPINQFNVKKN